MQFKISYALAVIPAYAGICSCDFWVVLI